MAVEHGEGASLHAILRLVAQRDLLRSKGPRLRAIFVGVTAWAARRGDDGLCIFVYRIDVAGSVHPSGAIVEALIDEDLPPRDRSVGVQTLVAGDL